MGMLTVEMREEFAMFIVIFVTVTTLPLYSFYVPTATLLKLGALPARPTNLRRWHFYGSESPFKVLHHSHPISLTTLLPPLALRVTELDKIGPLQFLTAVLARHPAAVHRIGAAFLVTIPIVGICRYVSVPIIHKVTPAFPILAHCNPPAYVAYHPRERLSSPFAADLHPDVDSPCPHR